MNLKYRKDNRTLEQFKKDIDNRTKKEKFLVELFRKECEFRNHKIDIVDFGVDNSGKLVKVASCSPDYLISVDGVGRLYDVKCSPVSTRCTFKQHSLKKYVEYNANLLLFYGVGRLDTSLKNFDKVNARFAIVSTDKIEKILEYKESYIEPLFGNKPCIKLLPNEYSKYWKSYKLKHLQE